MTPEIIARGNAWVALQRGTPQWAKKSTMNESVRWQLLLAWEEVVEKLRRWPRSHGDIAAARGILLAIARAAWGDPHLAIVAELDWDSGDLRPTGRVQFDSAVMPPEMEEQKFADEDEALIAALEAAPATQGTSEVVQCHRSDR